MTETYTDAHAMADAREIVQGHEQRAQAAAVAVLTGHAQQLETLGIEPGTIEEAIRCLRDGQQPAYQAAFNHGRAAMMAEMTQKMARGGV